MLRTPLRGDDGVLSQSVGDQKSLDSFGFESGAGAVAKMALSPAPPFFSFFLFSLPLSWPRFAHTRWVPFIFILFFFFLFFRCPGELRKAFRFFRRTLMGALPMSLACSGFRHCDPEPATT